ncbi:MAG: carbohydrate binding domain-containing protein [Bacteroidaceae bacterium]|nr:carbohydrate binding domain-containing protein [Bacteroidaceae bacterium]
MKLRHLLLGAAVLGTANIQLPTLDVRLGVAQAASNVITVNAKKPGAPIQKTQWGIFFEDINFAADGGLYGELLKNRSFEFTPDHLMGWQAFGKVEIKNDGPFNRNPHYARLTSAGHRDLWTGLQNEGFFGIGLEKDAEYRFSVWARVPDGQPQWLWIQFVDQNTMDEHQEFTNTDLKVDSREWKKYTVVIKSPRTIERAQLRLFLCDEKRRSGSGAMDVEHISLFPVDTYKGHENGMRRDVAQALEDLRPGVFRFPGGCIVEGTTLELRYQWKNSVGPVENRPINKNRWENTFTYRYYADYFQSYGLGFFEYFQLAEEIGAEPLPVLNVGMACQFQNGEDAHAPATKAGLQQFIDDCIDLIDFANGDPATNEWAKLRADMGHPAPFNLKFLAIGNEQWEKPYFDRLAIIAPEVRKVHPEIKLIGTSGPNAEDDHFKNGWPAMRQIKADLVDEHYYRDVKWYQNWMNRYDDREFYTKDGPRVFAGEWACHDRGKKWNHAGASIYEAAFMTNIERNADLVHMATYAPLFAHVDGWQWRPDLIWYDNLHTARTASYYVQQLYMTNRGTNVLPTTVSIDGGQASVNPVPKGEDGVFASSVIDTQKQEIIVKVINTTGEAQQLTIQLTGLSKKQLAAIGTSVSVTSLDCSDYDAENQPGRPEVVSPKSSTATLVADKKAASLTAQLPAKTFQVYRVKL